MRPLLRLCAGIGLFAGMLWYAHPARVLAALGAGNPAWLAVGTGAALTATLISALRWHALATWLGIPAPRTGMIVAYFRGIAANTLLPGATLSGDMLRALHLRSVGHPLALAVTSVALDRISGVWVLAAISLAASVPFVAFLPAMRLPFGPESIASLAVLVLAGPALLWRFSLALQPRLPERVADLLDLVRTLPRPGQQYFSQLAWSGGVQLFSILAFACAGRSVGLEFAIWIYFIAAGPIFILAALPLSIGGWGTREAASALTLGAFGAGRDQAVAAAIIYGLFAAAQGLLGALSLLHSRPRTNISGEKHD